MTDDDEAPSPREAQEALAVEGRAASTAQAAARRYLRRYLLGLGIAFALWLLALAAIGQGLSIGTLARATLVGVTVALLVVLATVPAAREPVRARLSGRARTATVAGGALVFAVPAAVSQEFPVVAAVGSLVVFAYWAVCALWFGRAG